MKLLLPLALFLATVNLQASPYLEDEFGRDYLPFGKFAEVLTAIADHPSTDISTSVFYDINNKNIENVGDLIQAKLGGLITGIDDSDDISAFCEENLCEVTINVKSAVDVIAFDGFGQPDNYATFTSVNLEIVGTFKDSSLAQLESVDVVPSLNREDPFDASLEENEILFRKKSEN